MDFITIYSTHDDHEISILEGVFKEEGVRYDIHTAVDAQNSERTLKKLRVAEADKEKARELLDQTGFITVDHQSRIRRPKVNKMILIFLALLILIIVAMLITWFMNVD